MKKMIIMVVVGMCIALSVLFPHAMLSPGELVEGHQNLNNSCFDCHSAFLGIANNKCISCHTLAEIDSLRLQRTETKKESGTIQFHKLLSGQDCSSCHTDHMGMQPGKITGSFQHAMLEYRLIANCAGCHLQPVDNLHKPLPPNCGSCHNTSGWKLPMPFDHNQIKEIDKNNCTTCHEIPIDAFHRQVTARCDQCHTLDKWVPSTFDHSTYFFLDKDHNVSCITCHTNKDYLTYTCYGCHEHSERSMIAKHREEGIFAIKNCASCHKSASGHEIRSGEGINLTDRNTVREYIRQQEARKKGHKDDD